MVGDSDFIEEMVNDLTKKQSGLYVDERILDSSAVGKLERLGDFKETKIFRFSHFRKLDSRKEDFGSFEGIHLFQSLSEIRIGNPSEIPVFSDNDYSDDDFGVLSSRLLESRIRSLRINNGNIKSLGFLRRYKELNHLELCCANLEDVSALRRDCVSKRLTGLKLVALNRKCDISHFDRLKNLKKLEVIILEEPDFDDDWNGHRGVLYSPVIGSTVEELIVENAGSDFLKLYSRLKSLELKDRLSTDCNFFNYENLQETVEALKLEMDLREEYDELRNESKRFVLSKSLSRWKKLSRLDLSETSVNDISGLLDCEFVKNGSLGYISIPDTIDWTNRKNALVVRELKSRGVIVDMPGFFKYEEANLDQPSTLYIICGIAGSGKSTLISRIEAESGVRAISKVTTRGVRPDDGASIIHVTQEVFSSMARDKRVGAIHDYYQQRYGIDYLSVLAAQQTSGERYFFDTADIEAALRFRDSHKGFVKLILWLPLLDETEGGLLTREEDLKKVGNLEQLENTRRRRMNSVDEWRRLASYQQHADFKVVGVARENGIKSVVEYIGKI